MGYQSFIVNRIYSIYSSSNPPGHGFSGVHPVGGVRPESSLVCGRDSSSREGRKSLCLVEKPVVVAVNCIVVISEVLGVHLVEGEGR